MICLFKAIVIFLYSDFYIFIINFYVVIFSILFGCFIGLL